MEDDDDQPRRGAKRNSRTYKANNEGGFGNPPVKGQFKKGGTPGPGRRRGTTSLNAALTRMFASKVPVSFNGEVMSIPMAEAMAERLRKEMLSGNFKALELGFELLKKYGPRHQSNELPMYDFSQLTTEEKLALRRLLMTADMVERREVFNMMRQGKAWHDAKKANKGGA